MCNCNFIRDELTLSWTLTWPTHACIINENHCSRFSSTTPLRCLHFILYCMFLFYFGSLVDWFLVFYLHLSSVIVDLCLLSFPFRLYIFSLCQKNCQSCFCVFSLFLSCLFFFVWLSDKFDFLAYCLFLSAWFCLSSPVWPIASNMIKEVVSWILIPSVCLIFGLVSKLQFVVLKGFRSYSFSWGCNHCIYI